jgi:hypothetical protein
LNFKELQDECVVFRFGENRRNSIKLWLNRRMQAVWGEAEWPFKRVNRQDVLTDTNGQLVMPVGFRRAIAVEDNQGNALEYMVAEEFRENFQWNQVNLAPPSTYTTWNGQVLFDSNPGGIGIGFKLSYIRRICCYQSPGELKEGLMVNDNDTPLWDPEHHFLLVLGATSTGLKLENDFTWSALEDEFGMALTEMKDDLLPPDAVGTTQYGADNLF